MQNGKGATHSQLRNAWQFCQCMPHDNLHTEVINRGRVDARPTEQETKSIHLAKIKTHLYLVVVGLSNSRQVIACIHADAILTEFSPPRLSQSSLTLE